MGRIRRKSNVLRLGTMAQLVDALDLGSSS